MKKVIIDCNVIISSVINSQTCTDCFDKIFQNFQICLSHDIFDEYIEVINEENLLNIY